MTDSSRAYLTGITSLTASVLLNSAVFFSVDLATSKNNARPLQLFKDSATREIVQFEFVEAPPAPAPQKPQKTRKIAERDSIAQDASKGAKKDLSPKAQSPGRSDQLAQRPGYGAPSAKTAVATQSQSTSQPKKEPPKKKSPGTTPAVSGPATPWMPGQAKVLTQETAKTGSKGARLYGVTSFEATGSGMGVYMKNLKERIWTNWFPYVAFKFPRDFRGADAVIRFTLDSKGRVKSAKIVDSKGTPVFATFCVEAIERARNFGPLPKEIIALTGKDELEISFGFHYG